MMSLFNFLGFVFISLASAQFQQGIDISQPIYPSQIDCLWKNNITTIYIRGYTSASNGMFDYNACNSFRNVHHYKKLNTVYPMIYMNPCPNGSKSAKQQFDEMYHGLMSPNCQLGGFLGIFWLMVVSPSNWNKDPNTNINFIKEIIETARDVDDYNVAIHTNENDWRIITNNVNHTELSYNHRYLDLWLANAPATGESPQNLDNFKPFGGWTQKNIVYVQYAKSQNLCQVACNRDLAK